MTSHEPGPGDAGNLSKRQKSAAPSSPLDWLQQLRDGQMRLFELLELIEITPDELDVQAEDVHERTVKPVYQVMRKEVAQECGSRWDLASRRRLRQKYDAAADMWPAYREALAELKSAREDGRSAVPALRELAPTRREYISALLIFCDEFSDTLDFLFPLHKSTA